MSSRQRKLLLKYLLVEEIDDEEVIEMLFAPRVGTHEIFAKRQEEGYFRILITNHLQSNDTLFSEFFRLSKDQFQFVESVIWQDLTKTSTNRNPYPITGEEKLALTLRMSSACDCHFADSSHLASVCSPTPANISLFMSFVDLMIRTHCSIADPCTRTTNSEMFAKSDRLFDFIVVGGGVAGSVMAGRLSEQEDWRVLLLEAGPEEPTTSSIPAFAVSAVGTDLDWKFKTVPQKHACRRSRGVCSWPRGRMLGGTGAMTGMMYTRGHQELFDGWAKSGNTGWSYEEVLPYFIKSENNKNPELVESRYHGTGGPLTVQRFSHRPAMAGDILEAAAELGYRSGDLNGHNQTGFAVAQMMVDHGLRASTARMYVRANKRRKNLVVKINSQVTRIVLDSVTKKAKAVEFVDSLGRTQRVIAKKEVILSAGAVGSPHLLLLSGVGPRAVLKKFNIPVVQDLPVGQNLHNHVATGLRFFINDDDKRTLTMPALQTFLEKREGPLASTGLTQVTGFMKSPYTVGDMPDIQIFFDGFSAGCSETGKEEECSDGKVSSSCGRRYVYIRPTNILARSTGYLTLKSKDPMVPPVIDPKYLSKDVDVKVLIEGIKFIRRLAETKALHKWGIELDTTPAAGCEHLTFASDPYWECLIREHTGPENHPAGTCKMGPVGDPSAVVDPELRVHGITNLRVVDASVFPLVPNGNPVSGIIMAAEKSADMIRAAWMAPGAEKRRGVR